MHKYDIVKTDRCVRTRVCARTYEGETMAVRRARHGDIVINLQDTAGDVGMLPATVTDEVLAVWRGQFGSQVEEFRQKSMVRSSVDYEIVFITPGPNVDVGTLNRQLRHTAQTAIADIYSESARNQ